ncbi:acyl-CoA dehydratase activase [Clostridium oceanicum]|uniref:2-hydroxyisocaproyl-CoA dehydratase activator HadI n=1 Tax=Clostridium oceanicum TaxID=1543 RepID=A0ABN1J8H8_9CLOT
MYTMGIDIGSTASKGIILKDGKDIISETNISVGTGTSGPERAYNGLFDKCNLKEKDISKVIVTGYGRMHFDKAQKQISELTCHAKGAHYIFPNAHTIIDIGGQDAKALKLDSKGRLSNFVMNDKCAAGTGRFLDVMARVLEVDISDLEKLSSKSKSDITISSTCTVFAESEVISHLSAGISKEDIAAGIHRSIAKRVASLVKRIGVKEEIVMTGGVAQNSGVVKAMKEELNMDIKVSKYAQMNGALGAALIAWKEEKNK